MVVRQLDPAEAARRASGGVIVAGSTPPPREGDVFVLPETEYRYGLGPVIALVKVIRGRVEYQGEPWWHVTGDVANGDPANHGGFIERDLYIRETSMRQTRRVPPG